MGNGHSRRRPSATGSQSQPQAILLATAHVLRCYRLGRRGRSMALLTPAAAPLVPGADRAAQAGSSWPSISCTRRTPGAILGLCLRSAGRLRCPLNPVPIVDVGWLVRWGVRGCAGAPEACRSRRPRHLFAAALFRLPALPSERVTASFGGTNMRQWSDTVPTLCS